MSWCERHVDARVEDVRWTICEGAMMQAAARARHVRQGCEIRLFTNMVLPIAVDEVQRFDDLLPEEVEYREAPVRTSSPRLAQALFSKFEGMSLNGVRGGVGDLFGWAQDHDAEFIEVRLQSSNQWSRVWLAEGGWRWLCERVSVVDWRMATRRKDDHERKFDALTEQSQHTDEVRSLREAFRAEPWLDEDGDEMRALKAQLAELQDARDSATAEDRVGLDARIADVEAEMRLVVDETHVVGRINTDENDGAKVGHGSGGMSLLRAA